MLGVRAVLSNLTCEWWTSGLPAAVLLLPLQPKVRGHTLCTVERIAELTAGIS